MPQLTAVIPTTGRRSLGNAVESALAQTGVEIEVVVVADTPEVAWVGELRSSTPANVTVLTTGGSKGGSYARQLGTTQCTSDWVAYLDDDDCWFPNKSIEQLRVAVASDQPMIVSCAYESVLETAGTTRSVPIPRDPYQGGDVAEWLFVRRRLAIDRNMVHTSTLLVPTELALQSPWRDGLPRHQDWDFLLRALADPGFDGGLVQLPNVLCRVGVDGGASVSRSSAWAESLEWLDQISVELGFSPQVKAEFRMAQVARYAFQAGDLSEALRQVRLSFQGAIPSIRAACWALSGIIARSQADELLHKAGKSPSEVVDIRTVNPRDSLGPVRVQEKTSR